MRKKRSIKNDFNRNRATGLSKFMRAVENGYTEKAQNMIYMGANVNAKTTKATRFAKIWYDIPHAVGSTPLHLAASNGDLQMISLLIEARANINIENTLRRTPLDNALLGLRHFENILQKQQNATIKRKKKINRTRDIVDEYKSTIHLMIKHGAKTAMLHLPKTLQPKNKL